MTLIHGPWKVPDGEDPEDRLPVVLPGRDRPRTGPGKELVRQVVEAEIVRDEPAPTPVDQADPPVPGPAWSRQVQLVPLVPAWLADPASRRQATRWWVRLKVRTVQYHALRLPLYEGRLLRTSAHGFGRAIVGAIAWVRDPETAGLLNGAKADAASAKVLAVRQQRAAVRTALVLAAVAAALGAYWLTRRTAAWWDLPLLVLAVLNVLGWAGRRRDRPIAGPAVVRPEEKPLRSEHVEAALRAVGIREPVSFVEPIQTDGPGWRSAVDLPEGATATQVMERRRELASALRRPLGAVWPGPDPEAHPGRLVLWVGRAPMEKVRAPTWPLAKSGQADIFGPLPFGHDQRMRPVALTLIESNALIGSLPGAGKTMSLRVLLLAAALDPRVELRCFELKGTGDLSPFEKVTHHYGAGPSDDTLAECMASLREVHGLLETRAKTIRNLPRDAAPENKVTPALAGQRRLGLWPIVFALDEAQELFSHPELGAEAATLCTAIIKRGRALGIILLLATQRPDKDSLPTSVSANVAIRFCLRVMGHTENDMVLGTGMHRNGIRATLFTVRDKGIGWLVGASEDPQIVRSAYLDAPAAERVVARARAAREELGTLSGYALGEQSFERGPDFSLLRDLLMVLPEDQAHSDVLCARLAEEWPGRYGGWGPKQLGAAAAAKDVKTVQVWAVGADGKRTNRYGLRRADLVSAVGGPDDL